ncbi:MAG: DinB family protein [Acidobacteria bacterium]|nr:DinB family protein [Acidobacteriota bacterium]MDA1234064.1 DinB family protein [Acidobacteriota bacterium]
MQRFFTFLFAAAFALALPLQAQNPLSQEAQAAWTRTSGNLMAAAEKMPADKYGFKPAPESQSFGELIAHTASSAMRTCSALTGEGKQSSADAAAGKDALVAALGAGLAECDAANKALTDATATDMIEGRRGARSRLGTLYGNTIHLEHEYAQMAVHFRLNGLVPPSSDRSGR